MQKQKINAKTENKKKPTKNFHLKCRKDNFR